LAYGLLGFSRSEVVDTSAREENERALPPKNFESPGLLQSQQEKKVMRMSIHIKHRRRVYLSNLPRFEVPVLKVTRLIQRYQKS
jgi:hypothetical protein